MDRDREIVTRVEALRLLRIGPRLFRQLSEEYREELGPYPLGGITLGQLEILKRIIRLRADGRGRPEIKATIRPEEAFLPASRKLPEGQDPDKMIGSLMDELQKAEERRAEDRDRLLTALIRTQQEIAHLRQELAATKSRRDRKKGNFISRLFS